MSADSTIGTSLADLVAIALFILRPARTELARHGAARQPFRDGRHARRTRRDSRADAAASAGGRSAIGIVIGGVVGIYAALKVKMTAMPQMVALYNGAGGGAAALISTIEFFIGPPAGRDRLRRRRLARALGDHRCDQLRRLDRRVSQAARADDGSADHVSRAAGRQRGSSCSRSSGLGVWFVVRARHAAGVGIPRLLLAALLLGVLFVLPIGGADMPVVISLLNSFTGRRRRDHGFRNRQHAADHLRCPRRRERYDPNRAMGRAMNRPLTNVLFGAFGSAGGTEPPRAQRRPAAESAALAPTTSA